MSSLPNPRPVTIEEFELLPDIDGIQELLDGEVVEIPPPKQRHSALVKRIQKILERYLPNRGSGPRPGFSSAAIARSRMLRSPTRTR